MKPTPSPPAATRAPLPDRDLQLLNRYWRAANYLSVGQIYLLDNPLLREPLRLEHIKPRLLGHWGTTPGLNFIYAHMNRAIKAHDLNAIYVAGPGHGGPGLVANTYLEGTYSEVYPHIGHDEGGPAAAVPPVLVPGRHPQPCGTGDPGSIHEGGELGYALVHAYGAIYDNPDLIACCVVGDGEAETGPLAASWHSNKFVNPARDGAVLPILHLNGYKIANPTLLARIDRGELRALLEGYGHRPYFVEGDEPDSMHQLMAETLDEAVGEIRRVQAEARDGGTPQRPRWPMIVLDHSEGVDRSEGGGRQARRGDVPIAPGAAGQSRRKPRALASSSRPGCAATSPRTSSATMVRSHRSWSSWRRRVSGAWAPTRTPTGAFLPGHSTCPTSGTTRSTCPRLRSPAARHAAVWATCCAT